MFHELHSRSILKSSTWFILALSLTFITLTILNKDWKTSLLEAIILQIIKAILYYLHERLWNKSDFGQKLKKTALV
ncbi:MAG: DUF2061 domain-containing protein [Patescibacteria group bacterium]